ncbi:MAG: PDDEXK nuclease domain-containing protein, partial [Minisyncoccia bacterium]
IILSALLFTHNPDKYLNMLLVKHRSSLMDFFELGDSKQYRTYGEQVIKTNIDIISGFKEKYNISATPMALSGFAYTYLENNYHWKATDLGQETSDDEEEEGDTIACVSTSIDRSNFVLEKHLEDFLVANWESTELGELYDLIEENGDIVSQQYQTKEIGNIDLLVKEKKSGNFVVIELKKGLTSDQTVGQLTRYMGWVKKNISNGKKVKGIIIAGSQDNRLKYALEAVQDAELFIYRINFVLERPEK